MGFHKYCDHTYRKGLFLKKKKGDKGAVEFMFSIFIYSILDVQNHRNIHTCDILRQMKN